MTRVLGRRTAMLVTGVCLLALVGLAGCAAGPNESVGVGNPDVAGFWLGLWHGLISPITFLVSLFNSDVNLYEVHNDGNWYDFGFMIGVSSVFSGGAGSGAAARRSSRGRRGRG